MLGHKLCCTLLALLCVVPSTFAFFDFFKSSNDSSGSVSDGSDGLEELPTPSGLRGRPRPSRRQDYRPRPSSSVAQKLLSDPLGNEDRLSSTFIADDDYEDLSRLGAEYGGYGKESGYGKKCDTVNTSAVALLAFLFLLNLAQDIIQQVNADNARKRRDIGADLGSGYPWMDVLKYGGLDLQDMKTGLPRILIPLMIQLTDSKDRPCEAQSSLCSANAELSKEYGSVGRVLGSLVSDVVSRAFSSDERLTAEYLKAAAEGRVDGSCRRYVQCSSLSEARRDSEFENGENDI